MGPRFANRITNAQKLMTESGLDLLIVVNRENLIYFTGMIQIECLAILIPKEGDPCAVTLWLDAEFVSNESGIKTYGYLFPKENLVGKLIERIKAFGMKEPKIGFERYFVDYGVYDGLRQAFSERLFTGAGELFYRLRSIKETQEVDLMRHAGEAACAGMDAAIKAVRPGARELDILAEAEYAMLKAGSGGSSFRPQVVSGTRTLLTHPCASNKLIAGGEIVIIHVGSTYEGYCSKMCRTVAVGSIPKEQQEIYELVLTAQQAAIDALRPGVTAGQVDAAARKVIIEAGYGKHYLDHIGYGVGLRQSEFYPIIGKERPEMIQSGMIVDLLLSSVYVKDIGGPRVTDVIHVGGAENEILTRYPRNLFRA